MIISLYRLTDWLLKPRRSVFSVRYGLNVYIVQVNVFIYLFIYLFIF